MAEPPQQSLEEKIATPEGKYRYTRGLFATIADRYDLITRLLSFGCDQRWKRRLIAEAHIEAGCSVLDVACGTGDLALLALERGANVLALDFTLSMMRLARQRHGAERITWIVGDMTSIPVVGEKFDIITVGYGLRNAADLPLALRELHRCLRAGGLLAVLDFDRPDSVPVRAIYLGYLTVIGSILGFVLHRDPDTYRYIPASIRRYPGAKPVAQMMRDAGFGSVVHLPVFGGLMAIHVARKP